MRARRVGVGDLVTIVYGLLPLLLNFNFCKLLLVVIEGANVTMFTNFIGPILMIGRSPYSQINLIIVIAMCLKFEINLLPVKIYCIIIFRHFFNYIILIYSLITFYFSVAVIIIKVFMTNAKLGEFYCISGFTIYNFMIRVVTVLNLECIFVHLIHAEVKLLVGYIRWQCGSILILERFGDVNALFNVSLVMPFFEIVVPFSC